MIPILGSAVAGISSAETSASKAAVDLSRISHPDPGDPDIATDFVTLSQASSEVGVETKVAQTAQQVDKALLDMIA